MGRTQRGSQLLPVFGGTATRLVSLFFANERTVIGICVPSLALEMINAAREVQPHDGVLRTVCLSLRFVLEKRERRSGRWRWD